MNKKRKNDNSSVTHQQAKYNSPMPNAPCPIPNFSNNRNKSSR
ncbi:MAG: hypothetical protein AAF630_14665 [Cyanobacteria bacterium P01_C01_bin.38]